MTPVTARLTGPVKDAISCCKAVVAHATPSLAGEYPGAVPPGAPVGIAVRLCGATELCAALQLMQARLHPGLAQVQLLWADGLTYLRESTQEPGAICCRADGVQVWPMLRCVRVYGQAQAAAVALRERQADEPLTPKQRAQDPDAELARRTIAALLQRVRSHSDCVRSGVYHFTHSLTSAHCISI